MSAVFREEARRHSLLAMPGVTVVQVPAILTWSSRLLPVIGLAAAVILASLEYVHRERVSGVLASSLGSSRLTATLTGTVEEIGVSPGEKVEKGQVLAVIAPDQSRYGGPGAIREQLKAAGRRRAEINQQVETTKVQHDLQVQRLNGAIAANELERKALSDQITIQDEITHRLENQANIALRLAEQRLVSLRDAEQRRNILDDARTKAAELKRELARLDAAILQARSDLAASNKELSLAMSRLSIQALEIDSDITTLRGETTVQIVSPVAGNVDYVAYRRGQTAVEGALLFSLVPAGSNLRAELFVPSRAIARVKQGQQVRIEYDAFPAEYFGYATGFLSTVNETLLDPAEARAYGVTVTTPVYRLFAALSSQGVKEQQQVVSLRSGMTFTADILIERHPIYVWAWRELTRAAKAL